MEINKVKVFIGYSHSDKRWLDRIIIHLKPLVREFQIDLWSDLEIRPGSLWKEEIAKAISESDIAVLLISADFLASDFITSNELPPLLKAAEIKGKLILSIILSPSLFLYNQQLSQFQAVNDPSLPLLGLNDYDQEKVFLKVAELVLNRAKEVKERFKTIDTVDLRNEDFLHPSIWMELVKIGNWIFDDDQKLIVGSGIGTYLLSRKIYGRSSFQLEMGVSYSNFSQFDGGTSFINTGIIFGWRTEESMPTYYNILLTGHRIIFERVGQRESVSDFGLVGDIGFIGGERFFHDYKHLDQGEEFSLKEGLVYQFKVSFKENYVRVDCNGVNIVDFEIPDFLTGRVGVRAWRCQMNITKLIIEELVNN